MTDPESYDVFLSCPMAGVRTDARYQGLRRDAMQIVECLERECGLSVFFAGRDVESQTGFDEPDFSAIVDINALKKSRYFLLLYPEKLVSSVLVEAGFALALEKKAVYFVRDLKHLPFMLRHLDRVYPVKVYEYRAIDRILKLLREHKSRLFEPWVSPGGSSNAGRSQDPAGGMTSAASQSPPWVPPVSPPDLPLRPDQKLGPYTLVRQIGKGSYGVVWLAERRSSLVTTQLALKLPFAGTLDIKTVRREAELWVRASGHPNVQPVIEAEIHDGRLVIASSYAADGSLQTWLHQHGGKAPSPEAARTMCASILAGLAHLHARQLVHRDLKPANVLLEGSNPRIADFGLARVLQADDQTFSIGGTPAYMAPEAWEGERSEAADLWSVGIMLYEMLAGQRPFAEEETNALRKAIRDREPPPLPTLPRSLTSIVLRAIEKDPARRYASAAEMLAALRQHPPLEPPATITPFEPT